LESFFWSVIKKSQQYREKKLVKPARFFIKRNITANHLTFLSLIFALLAVYFLFDNWSLFCVFTFLHLLLDALDGVVARLSKETMKGKYFDLVTDSVPVFLILVKIGWFINDIYAYIVAALFLISLLVFLFSKLNSPFIPMRTVTLLLIVVITNPFFSLIKFSFLTYGYLAVGILSVYALSLQFQWFLSLAKKK
jgi:hypothetical protein